MYIRRASEEVLKEMIDSFKVVLVTGPRQVGKTTLVKHVLNESYSYVTLDDINQLDVANNDPKLFFLNNPGKLIIDEVQLSPALFVEIKRIVDENENPGQFILTGSQTFSLMENVSESLAGRVGILELNGLSLREINEDFFDLPFIPNEQYLSTVRKEITNVKLWETIHRGSMPELYRNPQLNKELFYSSYVKTYIERDVRQILNIKNLNMFSRFMVALAARTSQLLNYSQIANELGVDSNTIKEWVSVLEASGIIILLQPFSNNYLSRAIKTPMIYFMDTGLVSYLLKWVTPETLMNGAMSGQILETFVISEVVKSFNNQGELSLPIYFYRDRDMKEIDLVIEDSNILYPVEIKKSASIRNDATKHLSILKRAVGFELGTLVVLSLIDKKTYIKEDTIFYPITQI